MGTWHDPDLGRPIAAPLERCAELLGVDLAIIGEAAANVIRVLPGACFPRITPATCATMYRWRPLRTARLRWRVDQTWTRPAPLAGATALRHDGGSVATRQPQGTTQSRPTVDYFYGCPSLPR